jgi:ATP-dependent helicase YprA (DUF1998 family)
MSRPIHMAGFGVTTEDQRRHSKPDILLTNFMMLKMLMTWQKERDRQVNSNAKGLDYVVLDELHTYRERQGADVATMPIRRLSTFQGEKEVTENTGDAPVVATPQPLR